MKQDVYFKSKDGITNIHVTKVIPDGEVKAILQINHGMDEYFGRYLDFAQFLANEGFLVVGNDHLGHGESVIDDDHLGYFAKEDGNGCILSDIHTLRVMTQGEYPDIPYFMLGHSMGSFLTRQYICDHSEGLAGAIIMGTGSQPAALLGVALTLSRTIAAFKGWMHRSQLIKGMAFGGYNKKINPLRTHVDWLTKEEWVVDKYLADKWCTFDFTVNGYYNMFYSIKQAQDDTKLAKISKDLPILVVSGAEDPVGAYGAGVTPVYEKYKTLGIKDVSLKLYPGDRHEVLNETDRAVVMADILKWFEDRK